MNLYPGVLTDSIKQAQQQVMFVASFAKIRTIQIDVIDGEFVDNVTITPADLPEIDFAELSYDLHLMTQEPLDYVFEAIDYQDHLAIRAVVAQLERMSDQEVYLETVKKHNWQAGLSLDLHTPLESIDEISWQHLDVVQLMGIEAGFQGQEFQPSVLQKIKELRDLANQKKRDIEIIIDGGVKPTLVPKLEKTDADSIVVGSGLWKTEDISKAVKKYLD